MNQLHVSTCLNFKNIILAKKKGANTMIIFRKKIKC